MPSRHDHLSACSHFAIRKFLCLCTPTKRGIPTHHNDWSTQFSMLIANSLFVDCYFFASFCLGPSICTFPQSPLHTLLSEGRLLSWYINLDVDTLAYYYAGPISIPSCILRVIPVQDNSSALYKSRELSRNKDSFCSTLR